MKNAKSSLSSYLETLHSSETLSNEEEEKLSKMIQAGDNRALEKLIRHNLKFVISVVKETPSWHHGGIPFEDLLAMGNEGLIRAAKKWVPKNNARFVTYAKPFIVKGIRRAIDNEWMMIRLPVNIAEEIRRMKYHERVLTQELGRQPTDVEVADRIEAHPKRVVELRSYLQREPASLESFNQEKFQEENED